MTPYQTIVPSETTVGIIGLGYVGIPLLMRVVKAGFNVIGFDIDQTVVDLLNSGKTALSHINPLEMTALPRNKYKATTTFEAVRDTDVILICLPTPIGRHYEPNTTAISSTVEKIIPYLKNGQLIVLESTIYPGGTDALLAKPIRQAGFDIGHKAAIRPLVSTDGEQLLSVEQIHDASRDGRNEVFLAYSPEREDPGNTDYDLERTPKVVGGTTQACITIASNFYGCLVDEVVGVTSTQAAEMVKLLENSYRLVNIGLVNEFKMTAEKMGIDIWEVINAARTKPFGFQPFFPGPGLGGHCIPVDPHYLAWKAREFSLSSSMIEVAAEVNRGMPTYVVERIAQALNSKGKCVKGSTILIIGLSYKPDVEDIRNSPSLEIIDQLKAQSAIVRFHDPHVPHYVSDERDELRGLSDSCQLTADQVKLADCVVIATDHTNIDYELIRTSAKLIVDTRGRFAPQSPKVIQA